MFTRGVILGRIEDIRTLTFIAKLTIYMVIQNEWVHISDRIFSLETLVGPSSVHRALVLTVRKQQSRGCFCFVKPWINVQTAQDTIIGERGKRVEGYAMLRVSKKLNLVKAELRKWNRQSFGRVGEKAKPL